MCRSTYLCRIAAPIEQDSRIRDAFPDLEISDRSYRPGGHDQINLVTPREELNTLMDRDSVRLAVRTFNHRLMKKGPARMRAITVSTWLTRSSKLREKYPEI
jgi:hypothetical protein